MSARRTAAPWVSSQAPGRWPPAAAGRLTVQPGTTTPYRPGRSCACRKPRPGHATRRYSLIRPPARVCLRTPVLLKIDRFGQRLQRRGAVQGAVRPVLVVVGLVLGQDPPQMVLVPDQGAVRELAAACADPVGLDYSIWPRQACRLGSS